MNIIFRLTLLTGMLSISSVGLYAGIQAGKEIPDQVQLLNDTNSVVTIDGEQYEPKERALISTHSQTGKVDVQYQGKNYVYKYPVYDPNKPTKEIFTIRKNKVSNVVGLE